MRPDDAELPAGVREAVTGKRRPEPADKAGMSEAPGPKTDRPARTLAVVGALGATVCLVAGLARVSFEPRPVSPPDRGRIAVEGPEAPFEILRDERGIPHVEAGGERDAWFGLGWVHAQDRLGQMLWLRALARGRTAELVGPDGLAADRLARLLGLARLSEAQAERLARPARRALEAYARGVNARLARIRGGEEQPPVGFEPGGIPQWTPTDSLAVAKLHAWTAGSSVDTALLFSDLIELLGPEVARVYVGSHPSDAPVLPSATDVEPGGPTLRQGFDDPLRAAVGGPMRGTAWVVAGDASHSGRPLLAAQLELAATAPSLLHASHLRGGGLDVAGFAIPGIPVYWMGRNPHLAWAAMPTGAVVTDLAIESLAPNGSDRYHDGRRWRDLTVRDEVLAVKGADDVVLRVRETRHGPLLDPLLADEREPLAVAWTGSRPGDGVASLMDLARARSGAELRRALALHHEPVVNVAWVGAAGEAGTQVAGYVPVRGLPTGVVPVSGRSEWSEWQGRVAARDLPAAGLGGRRSWRTLADAAPGSGAGDAAVEWLPGSSARSTRASLILSEARDAGPLDVQRLAQLQRDVHEPGARQRVQIALDLAGDLSGHHAEERELATRLRDWDGSSGAGSIGATVHHAFLAGLLPALLGPALGETLWHRYISNVHTDPVRAAQQILEAAAEGRGAASGWTRAVAGERVRVSLREARRGLRQRLGAASERWTWGRLHRVRFQPFAPLGPGLAGELWPLAGSDATLSAARWNPREPFAVRHATTQRMAVDAAELDKMLISSAPGQTEHAGHPHRLDGIEPWLAGRPALFLTSRLLLEERAVATLRLEPRQIAERAADSEASRR